MRTPLQRLLERFPQARKQANGWYEAKCPVHDDRHESFGFREHPDGHCSIRCQAGCGRQEILSALGWEWIDLYPPREAAASSPTGPREVCHYVYTDADGNPLFQKVRFEPGRDGRSKEFRCRRPDPSKPGAWVWNLHEVPHVLYRLPQVREAVAQGATVYVCEGEKDADNLAALGVCTTTNYDGAGKWQPSYTKELEGADVVVLPDNDDAGRKHAERVSWALRGQARSVRVVELPDRPEGGGDVTDWLRQGGTVEELARLVESAPIGRFPLSDAGNAERLVGRHGQDFRYLRYGTKTGEWLVWDGQRWSLDVRGEMTRRALDTVRSVYAEAAKEPDDDRRKRLVGHALESESARALGAMTALARDLGGVSVLPDEFDADPWLLNCTNGVVDLRTGALRSHRREEMMMRMARCAYDPAAKAPRWERFLREVFKGDLELAGYMERVLGYALTGQVYERQLWICYGKGRNGKGTLLELVGELLGDYAQSVRADILMLDEHRPGQPTDLSALPGARFVSTEETQEGRRLDEARVKNLTGGIDTLKARHLYHEEFGFKAQFKLFMATNAKPNIRGLDEGIWDRVRLVPFAQRFSDDEQELAAGALPLEKGLPDVLRAEFPGILARLVKACLAWQADGLQEPECVKVASAAYRSEMDLLAAFIADCCVLGQAETCAAKELYSSYCSWCENAGEKPLTQKGFGSRMGKRDGIETLRKAAGVRYVGIRPLTEMECMMKDGEPYSEESHTRTRDPLFPGETLHNHTSYTLPVGEEGSEEDEGALCSE